MDRTTKNIVISVSVLVVAAVLWFGIITPMRSTAKLSSEFRGLAGDAVVYKAPTCGCCGFYVQYLSSTGGIDAHVEQMQDLTSIKEKYHVPQSMQSCHTMVVGGYFVEGHVPLEAVTKLLKERPDLAGIAVPGMPPGSPGMSGSKTGPFVVYGIGKDGSVSEFMRV